MTQLERDILDAFSRLNEDNMVIALMKLAELVGESQKERAG